MKGIAIIPARGGSKRFHRKNIIDFMGKPIITWTIHAAIETSIFEQIIVSTEDDEIAEIASQAGAEVDYRDIALATDEATVNMVCLDVLGKQDKLEKNYDFICCLYATAPLRNAQDIINTVELVTSKSSKNAMAVTNFSLPAFQAMFYSPENKLSPLLPNLINKRSTELNEIVVDNGSTYVATVNSFKEANGFLAPDMYGYKMDKMRSIDIDEEDDYNLALYYAELLCLKELK
jgi:pseudaminic acid cytidylyltransferase